MPKSKIPNTKPKIYKVTKSPKRGIEKTSRKNKNLPPKKRKINTNKATVSKPKKMNKIINTKGNSNVILTIARLSSKKVTVMTFRDLEKNIDVVTNKNIVKNKGGGYSLKESMIEYALQNPNYPKQIRTHYYKTWGLLNYYGEGRVWDKKMNLLPRLNKQFRKNAGLTGKHTQIKGTLSTRKIKVAVPQRNVENSITSFRPDIGMAIGISVHQEIEQFIKFGKDVFQKVCPEPNPMTLAIIEALAKRNYIGIDAEYPVFFSCPNFQGGIHPTNIASSIDLICLEKNTQMLVLVEIKTGYSHGSFYTSFQKEIEKNSNCNSTYERDVKFLQKDYRTNFMLNDFRDLKDTPLNRAQIQLITYMYFFKKTLKEPCNGTVLHCSTDGVVKFFDIGTPFYEKYIRFIKKNMCI